MSPTKPDGTPVINQDDIVMGSAPLAEGGFGAVYKAQWKSANNMIVAVKVGRCMPLEINRMVSLKPHPNIIAFHGLVKVSEFETHIVMEVADKGSIYSHMKPFIDRGLRLAPALSLQWAMEIALGVQYISSPERYCPPRPKATKRPLGWKETAGKDHRLWLGTHPCLARLNSTKLQKAVRLKSTECPSSQRNTIPTRTL